MIRVIIAEDYNLVRQGIRALLEQSGEVQVLAEGRVIPYTKKVQCMS